MQRIIIFVRNLFFKMPNKTPLGRWSIEVCNKKTDKKIDLANEDHCGPCGKYIKNILNDKNTKI